MERNELKDRWEIVYIGWVTDAGAFVKTSPDVYIRTAGQEKTSVTGTMNEQVAKHIVELHNATFA